MIIRDIQPIIPLCKCLINLFLHLILLIFFYFFFSFNFCFTNIPKIAVFMSFKLIFKHLDLPLIFSLFNDYFTFPAYLRLLPHLSHHLLLPLLLLLAQSLLIYMKLVIHSSARLSRITWCELPFPCWFRVFAIFQKLKTLQFSLVSIDSPVFIGGVPSRLRHISYKMGWFRSRGR